MPVVKKHWGALKSYLLKTPILDVQNHNVWWGRVQERKYLKTFLNSSNLFIRFRTLRTDGLVCPSPWQETTDVMKLSWVILNLKMVWDVHFRHPIKKHRVHSRAGERPGLKACVHTLTAFWSHGCGRRLRTEVTVSDKSGALRKNNTFDLIQYEAIKSSHRETGPPHHTHTPTTASIGQEDRRKEVSNWRW